MNTFKDDVKSILSEAEPLQRLPSTKATQPNNTIHITKYDYKNNNFVIVFAFVAICFALVTALSFHKPPLPPRPVFFVQEHSKIDKRQADEIKILVKIVSRCENKHVNTIHNELKRLYGYYRYREMDIETYDHVKDTLNKRVCYLKN